MEVVSTVPAYLNAPDRNDLRCANDVRFKFSVRAMARNKFSPSTVLKSLSAIVLRDCRCRQNFLDLARD